MKVSRIICLIVFFPVIISFAIGLSLVSILDYVLFGEYNSIRDLYKQLKP